VADQSAISPFLGGLPPPDPINHVYSLPNIFHKSILLILEYKYLKSYSKDFILKYPTKIWFSAQDHAVLLLLFNIVGLFISWRQKSACLKWFVPQLYQHRRGILEWPALKYFYKIQSGQSSFLCGKLWCQLQHCAWCCLWCFVVLPVRLGGEKWSWTPIYQGVHGPIGSEWWSQQTSKYRY